MENIILDFLKITVGFGIGLSLGAILSWRDNDYKHFAGVIWTILFFIYLGLGLAIFLI